MPLDKQADSSNPIDNVMIAAPCNIGWDNMVGDDRVRMCGGCAKNVYNTSLMTKSEIRELMSAQGKSPCLRIYRRADGTMITEDCPVGLRRVRDAWLKLGKVAAALWACAMTFAVASAQGQGNKLPPIVAGDSSLTEGEPLPPTDKQIPTRGKADKSAISFLQRAQKADRENEPEKAENNFKSAIAALEKSKHDPNFVNLVYREYNAFLQKHERFEESKKLLAKFAEYRAKHGQPKVITVVDGGLPAPDNE